MTWVAFEAAPIEAELQLARDRQRAIRALHLVQNRLDVNQQGDSADPTAKTAEAGRPDPSDALEVDDRDRAVEWFVRLHPSIEVRKREKSANRSDRDVQRNMDKFPMVRYLFLHCAGDQRKRVAGRKRRSSVRMSSRMPVIAGLFATLTTCCGAGRRATVGSSIRRSCHPRP